MEKEIERNGKEMEKEIEYIVEKPKPGFVLYSLGAILAIGLGALFLAAQFAFSKVMPATQAILAAALIEIGLVVEAITFIQSKHYKDNIPALLGLVIGLVVSGTYNFVQVQVAGEAAGIVNFWQLITLALGPLSALTFLAMSFGKELRAYNNKVSGWEAEKQIKADEQAVAAAAAKQIELEQALKLEQLRLESEAQLTLGKMKIEHRAAERERKRAEKVAQGTQAGGQAVAQGMQAVAQGGADTVEKVISFYRSNPNGTQVEAGQAAGVTRQRVSQVLKQLVIDGQLHKNGNGWEVLSE